MTDRPASGASIDQRSGSRTGAGALWGAGVALVAAAMSLGPFRVVLADPTAAYNALAADTFYYLRLAQTAVTLGFPSFDGATVSNGYMPFWQGVVGLTVALAGDQTAPHDLAVLVFWLSAGFCASGLVGVALFLAARIGAKAALLALPLLCPGLVFWLFEPSYRELTTTGLHYGYSTWSMANGMESGLGVGLFALLMPLLARICGSVAPSNGLALALGSVAFLILMARLDDIFLAAAIFVAVCWRALELRRARLVVAYAMVPAAGILVYMMLNLHFAGGALPSSGAGKVELFGFPNDLVLLWRLGFDHSVVFRLVPLLLCAATGVVTLLSLALWRSDAPGWRHRVMAVLAGYLVLKTVFLLSSVAIYHQGYWYYSVMLMSVNMIAVLALAPVLMACPRRLAAALVVVAAFATALQARSVEGQLARFPDDGYPGVFREACLKGPALRLRLAEAVGRSEAELRIIDTADGAYAYCLGLPAVALTGLPESQAVLRRISRDGFFAATNALGHDILVTSDVRWAGNGWRRPLEQEAYRARLIFEDGPLAFWQIAPPQQEGADGAES